MGGIFGGIVSILDWLKDKLPIQDRIERWKNELDNLTKERTQLLKGEWDVKKGKRLDYINKRIDVINQWLRNNK
jgi:hypothetical protein